MEIESLIAQIKNDHNLDYRARVWLYNLALIIKDQAQRLKILEATTQIIGQ